MNGLSFFMIDTPSSDNGAGKPRRVVDRIRYHWNPDKYNRQDGRGGEVDDASLRTLGSYIIMF